MAAAGAADDETRPPSLLPLPLACLRRCERPPPPPPRTGVTRRPPHLTWFPARDVSLLLELGWDPCGWNAAGEGTACWEGAGGVAGPREARWWLERAGGCRRVESPGFGGLTGRVWGAGGAGVGAAETRWGRILKGTGDGVCRAMGAGGGRRRTEGIWRGQREPGVWEESRGFWRRGDPRAPPDALGRFTEPVSACLHSLPKENLDSQFR